MAELLSDRYELHQLLGSGGYGSVYEAHDLLLRRRVAVKMLHSVQMSGPVRERFLEEARISSQLDHPSALTVYDFGMSAHGEPFLVTELLEGVALKEYLDIRPCTPAETLIVMREVAGALHEAHGLGIIHRDLKSANIYLHHPPKRPLEAGAIAKLLDFGIAKILQQEGGGATRSGAIIGTPAFMAPEQIRDSSRVDARCDQYSLGLVGWNALHGRLPYRGENEFEMMQRQINDPLPPLENDQEGAAELYKLIQVMTQKDPEARYPNLLSVIERLDDLKAQLPKPEAGWRGPNLEGVLKLKPRDPVFYSTSHADPLRASVRQNPSSPNTAARAGFISLNVTLDALPEESQRQRSIPLAQEDYLTETLLPHDTAHENELRGRSAPQNTEVERQRDFTYRVPTSSRPHSESGGQYDTLFPPTESVIEEERRSSESARVLREARAQGESEAESKRKPQLLWISGFVVTMAGLLLVWRLSTDEGDERSLQSGSSTASPQHPAQLGPKHRFQYTIKTRPAQSQLGYPIGEELEILVEDRLGHDVPDFEVIEAPKCLERLPDSNRHRFRVKSDQCGTLSVNVGRERITLSVRAQSWASDLLDLDQPNQKSSGTAP